MISRKNIKAILDCFESLYKKRQDIELVLLGDGEDRPSLEAYSKTLASASDIHFLGFRNDRLQLLRDFDEGSGPRRLCVTLSREAVERRRQPGGRKPRST